MGQSSASSGWLLVNSLARAAIRKSESLSAERPVGGSAAFAASAAPGKAKRKPIAPARPARPESTPRRVHFTGRDPESADPGAWIAVSSISLEASRDLVRNLAPSTGERLPVVEDEQAATPTSSSPCRTKAILQASLILAAYRFWARPEQSGSTLGIPTA